MKIEKFNEEVDKDKFRNPYELSENGELTKTQEYSTRRNNNKTVYLTDEEYDKLKGLSDSTKHMCELLDEKKKVYVSIVIVAIEKIKSETFKKNQ